MKCENCNEQLEISVKRIFQSVKGDVILCEKCGHFMSTSLGFDEPAPTPPAPDGLGISHSQNVDGFEVLSNTEGIPDEIIKMIKDKIKKEGINPEEGRFIALDAAAGDIPDDMGERLHLLKARGEFMTTSKAFLSTIHSLKHVGIPMDTLERLVRSFSSIEYEVVNDYLFHESDDVAIHSLEELVDVNIKIISDCGD